MNKEIISLCEEVKQRLNETEEKLATAESCTGGMIGAYITSISGSSNFYDRGFITYSNQAKIQMLSVCENVLKNYGAVSEQVAKQMAVGAVKNSLADIAISITGIAGPDGGTPQKPVGRVYIGLFKDKWQNAKVIENNFSGNREQVRESASKAAIRFLLDEI